jgi:hypothetical protein
LVLLWAGEFFNFAVLKTSKAAISLQIFKPKNLFFGPLITAAMWSIRSRGPARILHGHKSVQKRRKPLQTSVEANTQSLFSEKYISNTSIHARTAASL